MSEQQIFMPHEISDLMSENEKIKRYLHEECQRNIRLLGEKKGDAR